MIKKMTMAGVSQSKIFPHPCPPTFGSLIIIKSYLSKLTTFIQMTPELENFSYVHEQNEMY